LQHFIPKAEWPPSSPDLNSLDLPIWSYMLAQLKKYKYQTLPDFKKVIIRIWAAIPDDFMCAVCCVVLLQSDSSKLVVKTEVKTKNQR
jgi:hypothetical protein